MRCMRLVLCSVTVAVGCSAAMSAPGDVVRSFEAPCKYPSGLASDGEHLYVLDWRYGDIYRVDPQSGAAVDQWDAPTLRPAGIACHRGSLFISDNRSGRVFELDPKSGIVVNTFSAAGKRPSGLAFMNGALYVVEERSEKVYKVIPEDGTILDTFRLPSKRSAHACSDGTYLWMSDRIDDELYMVRPSDGKVIAILPAPGAHATGVAWHDGQLWNVDFESNKIYQIRTEDDPPLLKLDSKSVRCAYDYSLYNYGPGTVRTVRVNLAVPVDGPGQTLRSPVRYDTSVAQDAYRMHDAVDQWGNACKLFEFDRLPAGEKLAVRYAVDVDIATVRYVIRPERVGSLEDIPEEIREQYTVDGPRYRIESAYIRNTVRKVVGDEKNPYWIARKVFDHLIKELKYEMVGGWDVPEVVLRRGSGSCSEYTFAFIAMCRAAGLPARYQGAVSMRGDDASVDEAFHRWAQVYLPNYGWIPVDANKGDRRSPADQARGFGEVSNRYLVTTQGGGDSRHLRWGYNVYSHYQMDGYCHVDESQIGFWSPRDTENQLADEETSGPVPHATECGR